MPKIVHYARTIYKYVGRKHGRTDHYKAPLLKYLNQVNVLPITGKKYAKNKNVERKKKKKTII